MRTGGIFSSVNVCDVDGYWKFFPAGGPGGYIPDFIMKAVLDKLGELNTVWDKQIESDPAIADHSNLEDALEAAFWNFDVRCKGYSKYAGARVSERDAFKAEVRNLLFLMKIESCLQNRPSLD